MERAKHIERLGQYERIIITRLPPNARIRRGKGGRYLSFTPKSGTQQKKVRKPRTMPVENISE